ncbi:DoxX family protein [Algoriphagus resistens]|uniref:DoxX family protein n=1 Tax=Algoriphagus resistens TaxID=1750590 RepID=UPI000716A62E|nr:DoxX family protein [Algoriphagus resistens]
MTKRNKIIYWVATCWLSLGMVSTAIVQLIKMEEEVQKTSLQLGYPGYFLTIIGVWKLLGVFTILIPKYPLVKEWAYAGFVFVMTGALFSHFALGDPASEYFGPALLLVLTLVSWYFRPAERRLTQVNLN